MYWRLLLAWILACATLLADGLKAVPGNTDIPTGWRVSTDVDLYRPPTPEELNEWKNMDVDSIVNRLGRHRQHERILFVGDSVMRNMRMFLSQLIEYKHVRNIEVSLIFTDRGFDPNAVQRVASEQNLKTPPTVIAFNANLHLLHLDPFYPWVGRTEWMNYTSLAAKTFDKYHEDAPSARLIPTFMNALCPERWRLGSPMRNISDAIQAHERAPLDRCVEYSQKKLRGTVSPEDLAVQCSKSWYSNSGIAFMNEQLRSATNKWSKGHESVRVDLWDRYAMTHGHCADTPPGTNDGIHWVPWADKEALHLLDALQWL